MTNLLKLFLLLYKVSGWVSKSSEHILPTLRKIFLLCLGLRFNAGESFNVTLNAFEVLALRSVGDLTGAEITSTDKVISSLFIVSCVCLIC